MRLAFLHCILLLICLGCSAPGKNRTEEARSAWVPPLGEPVKFDNPLVAAGQEVFNAKGCVYCHGPSGAGGVKNNNAMGELIPPLTRVAEGYTDEELKRTILKGAREIAKENPDGPTPPLYMPAWKGVLSDEELEALVAFLKHLQPKTSGEEW